MSDWAVILLIALSLFLPGFLLILFGPGLLLMWLKKQN